MPLLVDPCKGASRKAAPFAFLALLFSVAPAAAPLCPPDRLDEKAEVTHVYDGDTLRLKDGRKVRLIGIDAPEVSHEGRPAQPYGDEATSLLQEMLDKTGPVGIRYDADRHDRYGRTLAHVYLPDGSSLTAALLTAGMGSVLSISPNLWNRDCYRREEEKARHGAKGVWSLPAYRGVEADSLTLADEGFRRVFARVLRVGDSRKSVWVEVEGLLRIRIPREQLNQFPYDPHAFVGRRVAVRGRIYADAGRLLLTVQDPLDLELQDH